MYTSSKRKRVNPQAAMRSTRLRFELVLSNCRPSKTLNGVAQRGGCKPLTVSDSIGDTTEVGGESLWNMVRELVAKAEGNEEIRWGRRADAEAPARAIESLVDQEADRRVAIWLRVRVGGERMTTVAADYGYRDGSGVHRVIKRLEEKAKSDRALSRRLKALAKKTSNIKS